MQYKKMQYGDDIDTKLVELLELVEWLKTLSKQELIFIDIKVKIEPRLTKKELERCLMIEKENMELCGYDGGFEKYLSDLNFYEMLKISEACKPGVLPTDNYISSIINCLHH